MDAMLANMSSTQFEMWMHYYQIEPFGHTMQDVHFATLESLIANSNRKKGAAAVQPKEFILSKPVSKSFDGKKFFQDLKGMMSLKGSKNV